MTSFLVSPAEPAIIRSLGRSSPSVEQRGVDIMWAEKTIGGLIGVQRKEFHDMIASLQDGRLSKELEQMRQLKMAFLIIEGNPRWTIDGKLIGKWTSGFTKKAYRSFLRSVQGKGIYVEFSDDITDTIVLIEEIASYLADPTHDSLDRRPKPVATSWGRDISEEGWACHLLQSFPDVGPKQAKAIYNHFGGKLPFDLTVAPEAFLEVPMVGPKTAAGIARVFGKKLPEKVAKVKKPKK